MINDTLLVIANASTSMDVASADPIVKISSVPSTTFLSAFNFDILLNYILFFLLFFIVVLFIVLILEMKAPNNNPYTDLEAQNEAGLEKERQRRREAINRAIHSI